MQTAYGGRSAAQVYNPWTGNWASTHQGHNPYAQWGSSTINYGGDIHHTGHVVTSNNLYAGIDGNVYKRDANGNWSKWDNGGWQPVPTEKSGRTAGADSAKGRQDRQSATGADRQQKVGGDGSTWKPAQRADGSSGVTGQQRTPGQDTLNRTRPDSQPLTPAADRSTLSGNLGQTDRAAPRSSDTMHQLNREATARQQGTAHERTYSRGANMPTGGMRMGGGRRR